MAIQLLAGEAFPSFLRKNSLSLIDFFAPWCGPCRAMEATLHALSEEFQGKVAMAKVNIDEAEDLAQTYGVQAIPTLIFFKGEQIVETITGARTREDLAKKLRQLTA